MKPEPRPAIYVEKPPLTAWVGQSLRDYPGYGANSVSQGDGVSDMAPPSSFVALWGKDSEKEQWPLPTFLSGRKLSPSSCPDTRDLCSSLYAIGAFQDVTLVLELRGSESE